MVGLGFGIDCLLLTILAKLTAKVKSAARCIPHEALPIRHQRRGACVWRRLLL
ncbi:hypothetical protein RSAG8_03952, partial [Rhizoctonia solani AG-8 WAC10335]